MKVFTAIQDIRAHIDERKRQGEMIGFVPTMGALHEGHFSLIAQALKENDAVVVSIFVNPLQFGPNEDYEAYPRMLDADLEKAEARGVDIVFAPSAAEMYPEEMQTGVRVHEGTEVLCGKSRPGHFDGVATVVLKLLQIVQPTRVYFGQKDAQQAAVVTNMGRDFNLPTEIVTGPTIREPDGLALSSRNVNLTSGERREAVWLYEGLKQGALWIEEGTYRPREILEGAKHTVEANISGTLDYMDILTYPGLRPVKEWNERVIIAGAVQFSGARLIDNIILSPGQKGRA
ncbi:pantoate--beta-alanine ligase [Marinococcus sp. PL1-022]|uniref:pantoate--beta-alanine ligase n=1 Tax=Marinococcus sp. PL1-022 TaxID=3095363 RepID=UPI0029C3EAC0|nr:pantoate--beta-alanine ligase [Marinococcus sp. PL1-022]MDX6151861.1 pantoate--beta-alanine ligase [Marinococcus sp. PL1-022]